MTGALLILLLVSPFSKVILVDSQGRPLVRIGIVSGAKSVEIRGQGLTLSDGEGSMTVNGPSRWHVRRGRAVPGRARWWVALGVGRTPGMGRGIVYNERGFVINLGRRMLDLRYVLPSLGPYDTRARAEAELKRASGAHPSAFVYSDVIEEPSVTFIATSGPVRVEAGVLRFSGTGPVTVSADGFSSTYPGTIEIVPDIQGRLVVVNELPLEQYIEGILPSEMFPSAPIEALKAQAVAARGQVLSKIGFRHLGDPYHLCASVHCQVYRGGITVDPRVAAAVKATAGQVLLTAQGRPVDTVYSAACGGHTEAFHLVWGGEPNAILSGRYDVLGRTPTLDLSTETGVRRFLLGNVHGACMRKGVFRWQVVLSDSFLATVARRLGIGSRVVGFEALRRGVSGRILELRVVGNARSAVVRGELRIRRLLGNLKSSMFVWQRIKGGFRLTGGGYGHGVGMCQWGAINRARKGWSYRRILAFYYPGARLVTLY